MTPSIARFSNQAQESSSEDHYSQLSYEDDDDDMRDPLDCVEVVYDNPEQNDLYYDTSDVPPLILEPEDDDYVMCDAVDITLVTPDAVATRSTTPDAKWDETDLQLVTLKIEEEEEIPDPR